MTFGAFANMTARHLPICTAAMACSVDVEAFVVVPVATMAVGAQRTSDVRHAGGCVGPGRCVGRRVRCGAGLTPFLFGRARGGGGIPRALIIK